MSSSMLPHPYGGGDPVATLPTHDAWGGVRWSTGHGVNDGKTLVIEPNYTGHSYDPILKIYHGEARFYDAKTRQWMASDPIKSGLNWYQYVASNPTTFVDPTGLFIVVVDGNGNPIDGTQMKPGASGKDVSALQNELYQLGYLSREDYIYSVGTYDWRMESAVKQYKKANSLGSSNVVTPEMWNSLGLQYNTTLEEEFKLKTPTRANPTIRVSVEGNDITISYFPQFYVQVATVDKNGKTMFRAATDTEYDDYVKAYKDGVLKWADGDIKIQGLNAKIIVNIEDRKANSISNATAQIRVALEGKYENIVADSFVWDMNKNLAVSIYQGEAIIYDPNNKKHTIPIDKSIKFISQHEFGHVLGLFDQYGYRGHFLAGNVVFPPATVDDEGVLENSTMKSEWGVLINPTIYPEGSKQTSLDYQMVLYAWSENELQLYTTNFFNNSQSQAFYR